MATLDDNSIIEKIFDGGNVIIFHVTEADDAFDLSMTKEAARNMANCILQSLPECQASIEDLRTEVKNLFQLNVKMSLINSSSALSN